jgi:hypothetical protein
VRDERAHDDAPLAGRHELFLHRLQIEAEDHHVDGLLRLFDRFE